MAKAMTKSEIANAIAEKSGLTRKQIMTVFEVQCELAYKNAKNTFLIPGIGKLVLTETKAKTMIMPFGPDKGKEKKIPARKRIKFRVVKAAKDAILGANGGKKK
jgi:DNA-binding protein HU-beta